MRGGGDGRVEQPVALDAVTAVLDLPGHLGEGHAHGDEVLVRSAFGGQFGELGLQGLAGVEDIGQAPATLDHLLDGLDIEAVPDEIRPAAVPGLDQPLDLQHDDRLLHGGPADAEAGGQVALGREPVAGPEPALGDVLAQPVEHLLVEPRLGHGAQGVGHGSPLVRRESNTP